MYWSADPPRARVAPRRARALVSIVALSLVGLAASVSAACGGEDDAAAPLTSTVTATATSAATPRAGATSVATSTAGARPRLASLRDADFRSMPYVGELVDRAGGGEVATDRVRFVDLTGDGVEEAVVVVEGGTQGDIGVGVYRLVGSRAELAFFRQLSGRVQVRDTMIVVQVGVPQPGDPACCPSRVRETVFGWRDGEFRQLSEQVVNAAG